MGFTSSTWKENSSFVIFYDKWISPVTLFLYLWDFFAIYTEHYFIIARYEYHVLYLVMANISTIL